MIEVTNNYLDNNEFYKINKIIFGETFPWYFNHEKEFFHHLVKIDENNKRESSFFVTPVLSKLLVALKATNVIHSSISFCVKTNEIIEIPPLNELDKETDSFRAILFLNTNNGYTQIVGGDKIDSVENRLLVFPSNVPYFHTTSSDNFRTLLQLHFKK
tara:strand:- start:89 stop:562 length:474 start_codon:yes stop_codon:yes gene_type:complete